MEPCERGDFPESLYEDLLKKQEEVINPIPARQTELFNEVIMRWQNNAIKWTDFACENSNKLGKRFRRRTGEFQSLIQGLIQHPTVQWSTDPSVP